MHDPDAHLTNQEMMSAADGELAPDEAARIRIHLESCWSCRSRMHELDGTMADFIQARQAATPQLPSAEGPRALFRANLDHLLSSAPMSLWERFSWAITQRRVAAVVTGAGIGLAVLMVLTQYPRPLREQVVSSDLAPVPDPQITPGAVLPLTAEDICATGIVEASHIVPADVAMQVFSAYGITHPEPRAYEVDYLITPALGGSDHIRNFWPQPYKNTMWNAHIKDALEDHLRQLVCRGELELSTAQQEISQNWIAAYQRFFRTDRPLPEHATFLKDQPWESPSSN